MKIFISWSGERSEAMAKALRDWFPLVLHYVEPWLSKEDIKAGDRWGVEVARELSSCNFGVLCLTRENIGSNWLLFEAGALAKSMEEGRVVPLLLDLDFQEISGPLAQFQAKKLEELGLKDLVNSINKLATAPISDARIDSLFEPLWPRIRDQVAQIPKVTGGIKPKRSSDDVLEDLVSSVRSVENQFRNVIEHDPINSKRRRSRIHPELMHMILKRTGSGLGDPINTLILGSFFREDFPWIYELALELYRSSKSKDRDEYRLLAKRLREALELVVRGPFLEEMGMDSLSVKMLRSISMEFLDIFELDLFDENRPPGVGRRNL